jgi:ribosomal protein L20
MPRVKRSTKRNDRRKKILKRASGYFLTKSKLYQAAQEAVERGLKFAYIGRKQKKRQFRSLWIVRINAACRANDLSYSTFINGLKQDPRRHRRQRPRRLLRPRRTGEGRSGQRQGQARNRSSLIAAAETIARAWLRPRPCCFYFQVQCDTL